MGKNLQIKLQRKIQKVKEREIKRVKEMEILIELSNRNDDYNNQYIEKFGRLDKDGDFEDSIDKVRFIKDRLDFWDKMKSKYAGIKREDLSEADINDIIIINKMMKEYCNLAESVNITVDDLKAISCS